MHCGRARCSTSDLKQAKILVAASGKDVSALHGMGDSAVFADEIFGFHVQQAAKKLVKAWLASPGEAYPQSHNLASLLDVLCPRGVDADRFGGLVDDTRYAVRLRYTPGDPGACPIDRRDSLGQIEALLDDVRSRLTEAGSC